MRLPFQLIFWLIALCIVAVFLFRLYGIYKELRGKVLKEREQKKKKTEKEEKEE